MMIISEPSFALSNWYMEIITGLKVQARKRRENITECTSINELKGSSGRCVCVVGSDYGWLNDTVSKVLQTGNYPIVLGNNGQLSFDGKCSSISADIQLSVKKILNLFTTNGKGDIALYGISNDSLSDICKAHTFCDYFPEENVFYNNGSFSNCFSDFYNRHKKQPFEAVLCANDYTAVSLIKHLGELGEPLNDISIISYSNTAISRFFTPSISTVVINHSAFGKAAFAIQDCIEKNPEFTEIHVGIECDIIQRNTTHFKSTRSDNSIISEFAKIESKFYHDDELIEVMGIDKLLEACDETDFKILKMLYQNKHSAEILEQCFLSESSLKYRIKKMKQICGKDKKAEVIDLLKNYRIVLDK